MTLLSCICWLKLHIHVPVCYQYYIIEMYTKYTPIRCFVILTYAVVLQQIHPNISGFLGNLCPCKLILCENKHSFLPFSPGHIEAFYFLDVSPQNPEMVNIIADFFQEFCFFLIALLTAFSIQLYLLRFSLYQLAMYPLLAFSSNRTFFLLGL